MDNDNGSERHLPRRSALVAPLALGSWLLPIEGASAAEQFGIAYVRNSSSPQLVTTTWANFVAGTGCAGPNLKMRMAFNVSSVSNSWARIYRATIEVTSPIAGYRQGVFINSDVQARLWSRFPGGWATKKWNYYPNKAFYFNSNRQIDSRVSLNVDNGSTNYDPHCLNWGRPKNLHFYLIRS